jgi:uncharacterized membrane protein
VSAEDEVSTPDRPGLRRARLEAFSDGVFAIAITLLVLDLAVPATKQSEQDLLKAIGTGPAKGDR